MYLVLLETGGNQNYIFGVARMRDVIGASELTYQAGTSWVLEAADKDTESWEQAPDKPAWLQNLEYNPAPHASAPIQLVLLTSGKAIALALDEKSAENFIYEVTRKALLDAPGLDLLGAYVKIDHPANITAEVFNDALKSVHNVYTQNRQMRTDLLTRAPTFPGRERCTSSGLPSEVRQKMAKDEESTISAGIWQRRLAVNAWRMRSMALLKTDDNGTEFFPTDLEDIDQLDALNWQAIVHADGNGLGAMFLSFHKCCPKGATGAEYISLLQQFSYALDDVVVTATQKAISLLNPVELRHGSAKVIPFLPLVLGGDDLTAIVDGEQALRFTERFIRAYEHELANNNVIGECVKLHPDVAKLSTCAGIAIHKPGYPFLTAYALAGDLIAEAKTVKKQAPGCSALDVHVLFDSSMRELDAIRKSLHLPASAADRVLTRKPYFIGSSSPASRWCDGRSIKELWAAMRAISAVDENDRRAIPATQLHALRTTLFESKEAAETLFGQLQLRYPEMSVFAPLFDTSGSTLFLDALELAGVAK
jgi:hypothetical protein